MSADSLYVEVMNDETGLWYRHETVQSFELAGKNWLGFATTKEVSHPEMRIRARKIAEDLNRINANVRIQEWVLGRLNPYVVWQNGKWIT